MRNKSRIDYILGILEFFWKANPDLRLGQILSNVSSVVINNPDSYYLEDNELKEQLEKWIT